MMGQTCAKSHSTTAQNGIKNARVRACLVFCSYGVQRVGVGPPNRTLLHRLFMLHVCRRSLWPSCRRYCARRPSNACTTEATSVCAPGHGLFRPRARKAESALILLRYPGGVIFTAPAQTAIMERPRLVIPVSRPSFSRGRPNRRAIHFRVASVA